MLQLSFSARALCMRDIAILMTDLFNTPSIPRFIRSYSSKRDQFGGGMLELIFQCPDDRRMDMKTIIEQVITQVEACAIKEDSIHILMQTLNFTDEFNEVRYIGDDLADRILPRYADKLRCLSDA
jgi:hypothetical protein